jgi:hypothetical protein
MQAGAQAGSGGRMPVSSSFFEDLSLTFGGFPHNEWVGMIGGFRIPRNSTGAGCRPDVETDLTESTR